MNRFLAFGLVMLVCDLFSRRGFSAPIVDNGPPDKLHGWDMVEYMESDDFVLKQSARLESVTFWEFETAGFFAGSIYWEIRSDNGVGSPGALLSSGTATNVSHVATGFTVFGSKQEFVTSFPIIPVSLTRATYWLTLHNGPLSNATGNAQNANNFFWYTSTGSGQGSASQHKFTPFTGSWYSNTTVDLSFQLNGVEAPSTIGVVRVSNSAQINFPTTAGSYYRVEYRDDMLNPWTAVANAETIAGTGDVVRVTDANANIGTRARRFYRVSLTYNNLAPIATSFKFTNNKPQISFTSVVGYYYRVEYKNGLKESTWTALPGAETITGTGNPIQITDLDSNLGTQSSRFYRVILF